MRANCCVWNFADEISGHRQQITEAWDFHYSPFYLAVCFFRILSVVVWGWRSSVATKCITFTISNTHIQFYLTRMDIIETTWHSSVVLTLSQCHILPEQMESVSLYLFCHYGNHVNALPTAASWEQHTLVPWKPILYIHTLLLATRLLTFISVLDQQC